MCPSGSSPLSRWKRERVVFRTWCKDLCVSSLQQVPFLSTRCAHPTLLPARVRFWTWTMSCTWGACQRIKPASSSPPRCGLLCSTMATWAASEICSSTARAKISGKWPKFKVLLEWSPPAQGKQQNRALATLAKTMACAGMGGTDMSVIVPEQAILAGPVREVGFPKSSSWLPWVEKCIKYWPSTLNGPWKHNVCSAEVNSLQAEQPHLTC